MRCTLCAMTSLDKRIYSVDTSLLLESTVIVVIAIIFFSLLFILRLILANSINIVILTNFH